MKIKLWCVALLLVVLVGVIEGGKFGGGGRSGSRSSSSSRGSSNWGKVSSSVARDRSRPRPQTPHTTHTESKPKPQPNPDNTRLSYGQHETPHNKPSAPPMETANKPSAPPSPPVNTQHVNNQQAGAPPAGNQPIGWNVGQNPQQNTHNTQGIGFDNVNKQAGQPGVSQQHVPQTSNPGGYNPNQPGGYHPNQGGYNPSQGGYNPNQPGGYHPNQGGHNPNQGGYNPNQPGGYHPNQGGYNPNQPGGYQPHQGGFNPNQGYHPNQGYPNQGGYGGGYGGYHPPGSNVHYGPVTYINGQQGPPAYSYSYGSGSGLTNTLLGAVVGFQVARMFSHSSAPQFRENTYVIHHYHHDNNTVPEKVSVQANTVVACAENITLLCIQHSFPVCMSNGTIMCASNQQYITPCKDNAGVNCIDTKIDCTNNPACNGTGNSNTTTLSVPCLSSVSIYGDVSMLKNLINSTDFTPQNVNVTTGNNSLTITGNATGSETTTEVAATTMLDSNNTESTTVTTTSTTAGSTTSQAPPPGPTIINNVFCVTVMAVPKPVNTTALNPPPNPLANPELQEKVKAESQGQNQSSGAEQGSSFRFAVMNLLCAQIVYLTLASARGYF